MVSRLRFPLGLTGGFLLAYPRMMFLMGFYLTLPLPCATIATFIGGMKTRSLNAG